VRNKIRRRLREALRKELVDNPLYYDFVIVARKASVDADFASLKKTLFKVLSGLRNEKTADSDNKNI
jgi:ribonuclease P protein component